MDPSKEKMIELEFLIQCSNFFQQIIYGEDPMRKNVIMSDVELSYEELQCLESHFRQIQQDALVGTLKHSPVATVALFKKIVSEFRSINPLESSAETKP